MRRNSFGRYWHRKNRQWSAGYQYAVSEELVNFLDQVVGGCQRKPGQAETCPTFAVTFPEAAGRIDDGATARLSEATGPAARFRPARRIR